MRESSAAGPGLPQLADLLLLVQRATESGLRAELQVAGEPRRLDAEVELAGYRVVQESLTNTIRYAPGAAATVRVAYRADGIVVDVLDNGPGPPLTTAFPAAHGGAPAWPGSASGPSFSAATWRQERGPGEVSRCAHSCRAHSDHPCPGRR
jgi:hypothetical protein